jgi:S-adenosylmethionine decarboxylase
MDTYGFHLLADLSQCENISEFDSESKLAGLVRECAKAAKANVLMVNTHKFAPQGISAIAVLSESHLAAHLYPENNYISFDCYTCGHTTDPWAALELFNSKIKPKYQNITTVERGIKTNDKVLFTHDTFTYGLHAIQQEQLNLQQVEF